MTAPNALDTLDFVLPPELEASAPPEARGIARDAVRLLVSYGASDYIRHARFHDIGRFLVPGDLLVINTSGTLCAALPARRADGEEMELHLSTHLSPGCWSVELRRLHQGKTLPFLDARPQETLTLPASGSVRLLRPYAHTSTHGIRLWRAKLQLPIKISAYLAEHGSPIRYSYVPERWPSDYYQTVFATEPGSAEMPSAGRAFTPELLTRLVAQGIQFAPLLLHTGVASLEDHEPPYAEYYRVPDATAQAVNAARRTGRRIIAVGTTVVRALETVTNVNGETGPGEGWTEVIISPRRGVRAVTGLLTGLHEPRATHLAMLEAFTDRKRLQRAYAASLSHRYLWHEFGDLHLLLP
jgi:S-adenosylmethionine:tRNA ribosyltransferase-isomerase